MGESKAVLDGDTVYLNTSFKTLRAALQRGMEKRAKRVLVDFGGVAPSPQIPNSSSVVYFSSRTVVGRVYNSLLRLFLGLSGGVSPACSGILVEASVLKKALAHDVDGPRLLVKIAKEEGGSTVYAAKDTGYTRLFLGLLISGIFEASLLRYLLVGTSGVVVNEFLLALQVTLVGLKPYMAVPLAFEASVIWNFSFNDWFTFSQRKDTKPIRFAKYNISSVGSFATQFACVYALTQLGVHYLLSSLVGIIFGFFLNYLISLKIWIPKQ